MHDWTLTQILYDWECAKAIITFEPAPEMKAHLIANGVRDIHIFHREEWGPSVSVNGVEGPIGLEGGLKQLRIEMQTGDVIDITAAEFVLEAP